MESDTVWRALASPHRRRILDLVRDRPRTTGELVREMGTLSRFAVMQHLGVLAEAGLVLFRKEGRRRLNFANPIPLREMYERWVSGPASHAAETDLHLKRYAENKREEATAINETQFRIVKIETEMQVAAPREVVFAALTVNYDDWWPHRYKPDSKCTVDPKPGGFYMEQFAAGGGAVTGMVVYIDLPHKIVGTGPSSLLRGADSYSVETLEDDGKGGTIVKRSMQIWGHVPEEFEAMFRDGTRQLMEVALRGYVERGVRYSAEAQS